MIKRALYFLLIYLLSFITMSAQEIYYGKDQVYNFREGSHGIIGRIDNRIITYRTQDNKFYLDYYDDSMNHKANVALDFLPKKTTEIFPLIIDKQLQIYYRTEERGEVKIERASLNASGMLRGKSEVIDQQKTNWFTAKRYQWKVKESEDRKYIAIIARGGTKKNDALRLSIMDATGKIVQQKTMKLDESLFGDEMVIDNATISNLGHIAVPYYKTTVSGIIIKGGLIIMSPNEDSLHYFSFEKDKTSYTDFIVKADDENKLFRVAALYFEPRTTNYSGTMLYDIPYEMSRSSAPRYLPHPEQFKKMVSTKNWKKSMEFYKLKEIIVQNLGGILLVTEYQKINERNDYSGSYLGYDGYYSNSIYESSKYTTEFNYGDICVMSYDASDILSWSEFIRKSQVSQDDNGYFSSFGFVNTGGSLVFLFNNFGRNTGSVGMGAVDINGTLQLSHYNELAGKSDWLLRNGKQISLTEIIIPSVKRNNLSFARIVY